MSQKPPPDGARSYKEDPAPVASLELQHPDSPHQSAPAQSPAQPHYPSPHPSNPQGPPPHHSPYIQQIQGPPPPQQQQQQQEVPYYSAHPSPYSTNSAPSNYSSSETPELMAAATMNRSGFPPISYHTPQSNSPASVQSPQHDQHGRPIYGQPPSQMPQSMYYTPYASSTVPQQSPYPQHPSSAPQQPMATNSLLMSHQQGQQMQHPHQPHPHTPGMTGSPKSRMSQTPLQRPPSGLGPPQAPPQGPPVAAPNMHSGPPGGPNVNPNAAPGPIPATTPLVVRQDQNGVQWIAFEYSRDRVKMEYTIRCDVESVNVDELPSDFKTDNCVYPRACCAKDQYKGNRLHYETECNTVGWALAQLNPCLRGKRGLIQRAVDSWRNSNQDPRLRSRRVRRMAKMTTRKAQSSTHVPHMAGPGGPGAPGVPNSAGLAAPPRQPNMGMGAPQMHHHHDHPGGPQGGSDDVSANEYGESHTHHHQAPNGQPSPTDVRQSQNFYPTFPASDSVASSSGMPPILDGLAHPPHPPHASGVAASTQQDQDEEERKLAMFGDLPESKRRKFILVDDAQRGTRVRVRVTLDTVKMEEMPDSYRKSNSVFPRSYFALQMTSPPASPRGSKVFSDEPDNESDPSFPLAGSQNVPVPTLDGEARVPKPRLTRVKRSKEITLNDLGYRMSWSQSRVFAGRTLFLQKSLDAYRNKMRSSMMGQGQDVTQVAPHFETRVGKRRWTERIERNKKMKRDSSP
ncbi:hypothetical protein BDU57DRAFT_536456 [Ampelomyces quisqualis]|uniref:DUF8032 domain-containing protein n=1 Tax=Ampelomyces quisqualis TaxID=50730 RepID=A0A6A5QVG4_AMPQU|nr:hypothetical protein BDU57DRAFT_536456 [Ampelomyces quisqualis]